MRKQKILGLDLGSNSIGWALLSGENGIPDGIIDTGSRIFNKSVEEKTPTPKNAKRREKRLGRRVTQRRSRRKKRMQNYLISLELLPGDLKNTPQPEIILNSLGNPYYLRAKALDEALSKYELGRALLHLVQRRGFLSNKKTLIGDLLLMQDPDALAVMAEEENDLDNSSASEKEETAFKNDIRTLRKQIEKGNCRTLGEYLAGMNHHDCKRNRRREGDSLRTDRQMYRDEFDYIWKVQSRYHEILNLEVKEQMENIIFFQRPLKLKADRQGRCSLEPAKKRARMGRLEVQKFRYLQDINNLKFLEPGQKGWKPVQDPARQRLIELFEKTPTPTLTKIRTALRLKNRKIEFNLDQGIKKIKGNTTACKIRSVLSEWDNWPERKQYDLVEDLITINKKSILKKRLTTHWGLDGKTAVNLCLIELEPGHANLSSKATKALLPFLKKGQIYSDARVSAGYNYEQEEIKAVDRLGPPLDIPNPIVSKGLHELRRVVNAVIAHHGKPDIIRIEMARDLEMNTKRYKRFIKQQKENTKANDEAIKKHQEIRKNSAHLHLSEYPKRDDKIRYRLWKDQDERCAYSNEVISLTTLFGPEVEIDHIIPYSRSIDDSYMNKVVCLTGENRFKGVRTPTEAYKGNKEKWEQIKQGIEKWNKQLRPKKDRFYMTTEDVLERDFTNNQLNDTRYISKEALSYLKQLGSDVVATKGGIVAWMRHQWGLNSIIGELTQKDRTDHRHHTIDAVVIGCIDRKFHRQLIRAAKGIERKGVTLRGSGIHVDPPWENLRYDTSHALGKIIVSHSPSKKISGSLHEETGAGFVNGFGTVYRTELNGDFKPTKVKKIIDKKVREIVAEHLAKHDNKPKEAFAQGIIVYHKDGKTPIKRVRVLQSKITEKKLEQSKFGVKDSQGNIFKWMPFGNIHHVEILKDKKTGDYSGVFITMMEAHRRAMTGTKSAQKKGVLFEAVIQKKHGKKLQFVMAVHKNDMVSIIKNEKQKFYRVQNLESPPNKRIILRLHTAAKVDNPSETLLHRESTIPALMKQNLQLHRTNVLGKIIDD